MFFLVMYWEHWDGTSSAHAFVYSFKWKTTCADWFIWSSGELEVAAGISLSPSTEGETYVCHRSMPSSSLSPLRDRRQAATGGVGRVYGVCDSSVVQHHPEVCSSWGSGKLFLLFL